MSLKSLRVGRRHIHVKRARSVSKTSTTPSDDSESDDDENERRKYISFKGGQCLLWSANKFGNNFDLAQDHNKFLNELSNLPNDKAHKSSFKRNLDGRHSLREIHMRKPPVNLDNILLNSESEYGFNPLRPSGSKAINSVKLRPLSLYSPLPQHKSPLKNSNSDSSERNHKRVETNERFLKRTVSYAQNDYEAQLEKKVLSLRAQPSNLKFQGSKGKLNEDELAEDLAMARRRRFVRRQLSFDSHPRKRWKKTLSLDSGLATDSSKSLKSKSFNAKDAKPSKSEELLDCNANDGKSTQEKERNCKSVEFLDLLSGPDHIDQTDADIGSIMNVSDADNLVPLSYETVVPKQPVRIMCPPGSFEEKPPQTEVLLSTPDKSLKIAEKTKRRTSFPQILSAFRLPNKRTFQKFIRKKPQESPSPSTVVSSNVSVTIDAVTRSLSSASSEPVYSPVPVRSSSVQSMNTYDNPAVVEGSTEKLMVDKSCSSYSLPRVDEDKESFEFSSSLERRSKSSNSISFSRTKYPSLRNQQESTLQRRMSDTVLSCNDKATVGCSPGRKFVRRLLSPVVCGLPSPDRYGLLNDSMQSLASYDSASIASESDITYPQLFDFGSQELTEEMTLIDKELLIRISWEELSVLGWMSSDKLLLAPNIMKMVQFFNRLAMMVSTSVLHEETPYRRAKVIKKAIKLACRCRFAKNYNSLKAILGGLQCTPIFRLKGTWKQVPSRYRRMFRELSELMSESNNFAIYRQELSTALRNPPCVPFLGNFLTQVAHTHAYMAVQVKYKAGSLFDDENNDKNDENVDNCTKHEEKSSLEVKKLLLGPPPQSTTHIRSDSDDSGVVLNLNRLSHASDDDEQSPRESCMSSPDEEGPKLEDVFNKHGVMMESYQNGSRRMSLQSSPLSVKKSTSFDRFPKENHSPLRGHSKSVSVDQGVEIKRKLFSDITNIINSRPEEREGDELNLCELQFWRYQICCVQYNIIPRSYIRRFLMNSPYNTEEENYKISLRREPPVR